jgi:alanine dehydrogenase
MSSNSNANGLLRPKNSAAPLLSLGLPQMYKEPGERRDFLPPFVAYLQNHGYQVFAEHGYGSEMGLREDDYLALAPGIQFVPHKETYRQDYVLVLRCPDENELRLMHPGACLISMLHYPTRPERVAFLKSLGLEAISLDSLKDDSGRRLVENLKSVAWNGVEVAMQTLQKLYPAPGFDSPQRSPLQVTLLGAGAVGAHVVHAATRYGNDSLRNRLAAAGVAGVHTNVVDYDITVREAYMLDLLRRTDVLIDATQRPDPSRPVIPNAWVGSLPEHAVILDLSVDPYQCDIEPYYVKGIEGIPQGNLDKYVFAPEDPAFDLIPGCIPNLHRRWSVSCYSWPGIKPKECMEVYGKQIRPILTFLVDRGGIQNVSPEGRFFARAIARAQLTRWTDPAGGENQFNNRR